MEDQWYDRIRIKFSIRKVTVPLEEQPHLFCWFLKRRNLARTWLLSFRKIIRLLVEEMETLAEQLSFWGFDRGYALTQSHSLHLPDYQYWPTARKDNYSTRWIFLVSILFIQTEYWYYLSASSVSYTSSYHLLLQIEWAQSDLFSLSRDK